MILTIDVTLDYAAPDGADVLLAVEVAREAAGQRVLSETLDLHGAAAREVLGATGFGHRRWVRAEGALRVDYAARVEVDRPVPDLSALGGDPPRDLDGTATEMLMASRYCPADRFGAFVQAEFPGLGGGALVAAIRAWVHDHLTYTPGSSTGATTALETFVERRGICRDYAHLVVTLARAGGVPARMASVYAPHVEPPDFHAVAEVWLDEAWHLVDATGMAGADEIALVGVGRDAADLAFLTSYGGLEFRTQEVRVAVEGNDGGGSGG
ncbi:transglutaminase family protein [Jannaschia sp. Os4]|uniref:transglutaminase-like domain-containing protein n=1 Tax=Jannaschia sp. Os4 TaxID=2807617 RepID=UPI0019393155|nr:transglutaminase family protein [Jannaschia sp. Os4]MBM2574714.1 transglutaminase family protein [Jannaschia sp. Os4]